MDFQIGTLISFISYYDSKFFLLKIHLNRLNSKSRFNVGHQNFVKLLRISRIVNWLQIRFVVLTTDMLKKKQHQQNILWLFSLLLLNKPHVCFGWHRGFVFCIPYPHKIVYCTSLWIAYCYVVVAFQSDHIWKYKPKAIVFGVFSFPIHNIRFSFASISPPYICSMWWHTHTYSR